MIKIYAECPEGTIFVPVLIRVWADEIWFECDFERCANKDNCSHRGRGLTIKINKPIDSFDSSS
jgi:hypothetical protein